MDRHHRNYIFIKCLWHIVQGTKSITIGHNFSTYIYADFLIFLIYVYHSTLCLPQNVYYYHFDSFMGQYA